MNAVVHALVGGALIGAAAAGMLLVNGQIAGVSGVLANATALRPGLWRWAFVGGLIAAGLVARALGQGAPAALAAAPVAIIALSGLLVGFGTRLSNGCTSGHGVCGIANLSVRSLTATLIFIAVAAATVFITHHLRAR